MTARVVFPLLVWWLLFSSEHRHAGAGHAIAEAGKDDAAGGGEAADGGSAL